MGQSRGTLIETRLTSAPVHLCIGAVDKNSAQGGCAHTGDSVRSHRDQVQSGGFTRPDGSVYRGQWVDKLAHGVGTYRRGDGVTYIGEFQGGNQHGFGFESWPDGSKYIGHFDHGRKTGRGRYTFTDGSEYVGQFLSDCFYGRGVLRYADGSRYEGFWRENKMHGKGLIIFRDGRSYHGEYKDGRKSGFGRFLWPDGRRVEGQWRDGRLLCRGVDAAGHSGGESAEHFVRSERSMHAGTVLFFILVVATMVQLPQLLLPVVSSSPMQTQPMPSASSSVHGFSGPLGGEHSSGPLSQDINCSTTRAGGALELHVLTEMPAFYRAVDRPKWPLQCWNQQLRSL